MVISARKSRRPLAALNTILGECVVFLLLLHGIVGSPIAQISDAANTSTDSDTCAKLPDGIHPDYDQACRIFFVCSGGRRLATFWCVRGYVFSSASGRCEPPDRAFCQSPVRSANRNLQDCPIGDGVFPDFANNCTTFHLCKGGMKRIFSCPQFTVFDWKTESCQPDNKVSCHPMNCNGKKDGIYPDLENKCKRYMQCTSGVAIERTCPRGQVYNTRTRICSRRSILNCQESSRGRCANLPDGYYPGFNRGCRTYEMCMGGQSKAFNCPANTTFNSSILTCDEPSICLRPDNNKCRGKPNGIYPDLETDCRRFHVCLENELIKSGSCPLGKVFNPSTSVCEPMTMPTCAPAMDTYCSGLEDGVYPDYDSGCSGYYICLQQRRIATQFCLDTNLFDAATKSCLPSTYVTCERSSELSFPPRLLHSYDCSGRVGLFPEFSSHCRQFIICAYKQQTLFECPNGTYFDSGTSSCTRNITSCTPPSVVSIFQCLPSDEGIYPGVSSDSWNECRRGVGFTIHCPSGQTFNIAYSKCRPDNIKSTGQSLLVRKPVAGVAQFNVFEDENLVFDCFDKPNGVYQSQNCRVFHICAEGSLSSFYCPSTMTFDFELQQCQPLKQNTTCDVESSVSSKARSSECDGVEDGMYADYDLDCRRYFVCESGRAILVYCPERQKFSSVKMICDQEDKVNCLAPTDVTVNATEIDFEGLIYHVEVAKDEGIESSPINIEHSTEQPISRNRFMRNNTVQPNSILSKTTTNKRTHNHKDVSSPPSNDEGSSVEPCSNGDTGFFPDYNSDCKKFHICFRTIRKTYTCPSVLRFNPESKNCDLPENVVCSPPISANASTYDCRLLMNQFVPDYASGCEQFIGCVNNMPFRFSCPNGKLFNPTSRTCETAMAVSCNPTALREAIHKEPNLRHAHGSRKNVFDCTDKSDGFYADFTRHCHVFYRCVRGKKFSHYCKQGLLFNPQSGICDFEENVVCSNSTQPIR